MLNYWRALPSVPFGMRGAEALTPSCSIAITAKRPPSTLSAPQSPKYGSISAKLPTRSVRYLYMARVGRTKAPPMKIPRSIPRAILLSARWLEEMLPVSHSMQNSRFPTGMVASIGPGRLSVATSTRVSSSQPSDLRCCMQASFMGFTPLPSPRFLPGSSRSVKEPE